MLLKKKIRLIKVLSVGIQLIFALILLFIFVGPIWWMIMSSFKTTGEIYVNRWGLPWDFTLSNYPNVWVSAKISDFFINSVFVSVLSLFLMIGCGSMAAYALVRFKGKVKNINLLYSYFVAGHIITAQVVAVSVFLFMWALQLDNTRVGLSLVYCASGLPFVIILCRGFFASVTKELFEAAEIDGCSEPRMLFSIMMPLSKPILATAVIFQFNYVWNEFILALVLIRDSSLQTLPLGVYKAVIGRYSTDYGGAFAAITITCVPVIIIFFLAQREFSGNLGGALKG